MLNHSELALFLTQATRLWQKRGHGSLHVMQGLWGRFLSNFDHFSSFFTRDCSFMLPVPIESGDYRLKLSRRDAPYAIGAIDGSQIYPDHHEGVPFFMVHTAAVFFEYRLEKSLFEVKTDIGVFENQPLDGGESFLSPAALVDRVRTKRELEMGVVAAERGCPILFDGSLIFWHLSSSVGALDQFFGDYCSLLSRAAAGRSVMGWFISQPQSRDFVNILRAIFPDEVGELHRYVVDADLLCPFLDPGERTAFFYSSATITKAYPLAIRPVFFYLNTGEEIARVEIPAWMADDKDLVNDFVSLVIDQCAKGRGYPVCLAEAHEQAVVRNGDREFFFQYARDLLKDNGHEMASSRKIFHKRHVNF